MNFWTTAFILLHVIVNVTAFYFLLKEGSKPYRIWAWMMTILAIPAVGGILFFIFGLNRKKNKLFNRKSVIDEQQIASFLKEYTTEIQPFKISDTQIEERYGKLVNYLTNANKIPVAYKNKVALLYDGKATFNAIFEACKKAEQSIFIQYYIFENGMLADDFMELFTAKRKQGVTIKFIYDGLGSWSLTSSYLKKLKKIGVDVACFLPVRLAALAKTNYRNHRKIVVVDEKIGFTGGINVADKYITGDDNLGPWADIQVQVEGMAVNFLKFIFYNDWYFLSGENLFDENALKRLPEAGNTPVQFVSSGPDSNHATILNEYLYLINNARKYLYIANPYLVPPQALLEALKSSAMSGVDVRIVVPKKSDSMMVKWVVQSHFETLLASGVKIYRYEPGFLHSKIILSDDLVCSVGTANLDIRSFEQNFEVNALIYDAEVTLELKKKFLQYQNNSSQVKLISFSKRSKITRMKENLARLLSPLT